jgi:hypothetical protein
MRKISIICDCCEKDLSCNHPMLAAAGHYELAYNGTYISSEQVNWSFCSLECLKKWANKERVDHEN